MRDLRKDLSNLFDQYSHQVVYVRRDKRFRCECYSERSGEGKSDCPLCMGTSFKIHVETHRTRRKINSVPETLSGVLKQGDAGQLSPRTYVYYFEHRVAPAEGDLVLEVQWDETEKLPVRILDRFLISVAEPKQGYQGRVEFYQVYCRYEKKGAKNDEALTLN